MAIGTPPYRQDRQRGTRWSWTGVNRSRARVTMGVIDGEVSRESATTFTGGGPGRAGRKSPGVRGCRLEAAESGGGRRRGADQRRDGDGKGARRPGHPRAQSAPSERLRRGELRLAR